MIAPDPPGDSAPGGAILDENFVATCGAKFDPIHPLPGSRKKAGRRTSTTARQLARLVPANHKIVAIIRRRDGTFQVVTAVVVAGATCQAA